MNEIAETIGEPEPRKKRKYTKRKMQPVRKAGDVVPLKQKDEFAGLTAKDCCDNCRLDYCEITGFSQCNHPYKGGLTQAVMSNRRAFERWQRAKKFLEHQTIDLRDQ